MQGQISGYRIGDAISGGGMSDLYELERLEDGRKFVLKIASEESNQEIRTRLEQEGRLLQKINHEHIVKLIDTGLVSDRPYLILERLDGLSLREQMVQGIPMDVQKVVQILRQIIPAVSALHSAGIIHRDLKPENVIFTRSGQVKLIDLGIGVVQKDIGRITADHQVLGTVDYMPPEQRHGINQDHRGDQYSLGAMVFEMLTGHCALGQFRKPSKLNPRIPVAVDAILLQALERDPEERFTDVDEFARHLLNELDSMPNQPRAVMIGIPVAIATLSIIAVLLFTIFNQRGERNWQTYQPVLPEPIVMIQPSDYPTESFSNSLGMKFNRVRAGRFVMGRTPGESPMKGKPPKILSSEVALHPKGESRSEMLQRMKQPNSVANKSHVATVDGPSHVVELSNDYWMGIHEVTVSQFTVFVRDSNFRTGNEELIELMGRKTGQPVWNDPFMYPSQGDHPVTGVSRTDAIAFCDWLSRKEGRTYRLPTEAEWEYACRGGRQSPWPCAREDLHQFAVFERLWGKGPATVGSRKPNGWGLYDMNGNVWEWCADEFDPEFYHRSPILDPVCLESGSARKKYSVRGGGYFAGDGAIRCTMRKGYEDWDAFLDRGHAIGFRVVLESPHESTVAQLESHERRRP